MIAITESCISNGQKVRHRETVTSNTECIICVCLYGNIVCHERQCSLPRPGCRLANVSERSCCPQYVCGKLFYFLDNYQALIDIAPTF